METFLITSTTTEGINVDFIRAKKLSSAKRTKKYQELKKDLYYGDSVLWLSIELFETIEKSNYIAYSKLKELRK